MAKSFLGTLAVDVAGKAMQLHGGFGYTWESGVHAYLKRAVLNRSLFGSPAAHRARLAARYGVRTRARASGSTAAGSSVGESAAGGGCTEMRSE